MAIQLLPAEERGLIENRVFKGRTLFSNGAPGTSRPDAFGAVYVFNDDVLYPESYLGMHPHENVEIVTVMISGIESHKDTLGVHENYTAGDVQLISSGKGLYHEGGNVSDSEPARHLQIWFAPKVLNQAPEVQVKKSGLIRNELSLLVSPNAEQDSLYIKQDVWIYQGSLERDKKLKYKVRRPDNGLMIYVIKGKIELDSRLVEEEDTAFIWDQNTIEILSKNETSDFVLIDTIR